MVHRSKVINGLIAYIDEEIVAKMAGGWKAWAVGATASLAASRADTLIDKLSQHPFVQTLGLMDGENIDIDVIYTELRKQAQKGTATVDIPLVGSVTFGVQDVETLYRRIMGA